ncbi:MAG TPA: lysophospholipid acyltransferase family protein [Verrucomicrobiae bacterium]
MTWTGFQSQYARGSSPSGGEPKYSKEISMRLLNHPSRLSLRLARLLGEFALAGLRYMFMVAFRRGCHLSAVRAKWLQQSCRRALRVFNVEVETQGPIPTSGLLVCNHLSYLDILVLGALAPAAFVAKREVKFWPILGWFAALAGTVFVDRRKRTRVGQATEKIENLLRTRVVTVLFPEGTSSDGRTVLPFKSALLEPATRSCCALSVGWLGYELEDGNPGEQVCYWKDMTLVPHLLNLLTKRSIQASVLFAKPQQQSNDRKELARDLQSEVVKLKDRHNARNGRMGLDRTSALACLQHVDHRLQHKAERTFVVI